MTNARGDVPDSQGRGFMTMGVFAGKMRASVKAARIARASVKAVRIARVSVKAARIARVSVKAALAVSQ